MKCDKCANEATIHELVVRGGKKVERHLCESCARDEGLKVQSHLSVPQILGQFIAEQAAAASGEISAPAPQPQSDPSRAQCPTCGTTYAQFRHSGLLGCADCYAAFEVQLGPLLQRAHEGGTHHIGKVPQRIAGPRTVALRPEGARMRGGSLPGRVGAGSDRQPRIDALKKQLSAAVAAEQYEQAAKLRDELKRLGADETGAGAGGGGGAAAPGGEGGR